MFYVFYFLTPFIFVYTVKKGFRFHGPSRDVTNQTLPGNYYIIPGQGELGY
jgi:hypothetical protein